MPVGAALILALVVLRGPLAALPPAIVFVSRTLDATVRPEGRTTAIQGAARGRLLFRSSSGAIRVLVDAANAASPRSAPIDVMDPDVSFDGTRVVFSGFAPEESAWRIFETGIDGAGLRQLTHSDRNLDLSRFGETAPNFETYDDADPCYLPDGRICLVSTRYPGNAPDERVRATNLYVMNADGSRLHRITTERFGADTPAVDPRAGEIVYSRWWRTGLAAGAESEPEPEPQDPPSPIPPGSPGYGSPDPSPIEDPDSSSSFSSIEAMVLDGVRAPEFPGVNNWFLASVHPDGTQLAMFSGFRLNRELTQAYRPAFFADGRVVGLFIPQTPFIGFPGGNGPRAFTRGSGPPEAMGGPQTFGPVRIIAGDDDAIEHVYASVAPIDGERMLVTASSPFNDDYDIYIQNFGDDSLVKIHEGPGTAELDAVPVLVRNLPRAIPDVAVDPMTDLAPRDRNEAVAEGGTFTFRVENIHFNAAVDVSIPNAPPVGEDLAIEFWMAPQLTRLDHGDRPILLERHPIGLDGRVEVELPAGVPLFELLRRSDGTIARGRHGQIFHVGGMNFNRSGQRNGSCVGCHSGHSMLAVPPDPAWTNLAPSAVVTASSQHIVTAIAGEEGETTRRISFVPQNLVDRRTTVPSEWAASGESPEDSVELAWSRAIEAREVVVYGPRKAGKIVSAARNQTIAGFTVQTLRGGLIQQELDVAGTVPGEGAGKRLALDPTLPFDMMRITVDRQRIAGTFEGSAGAALAEIEVTARLSTRLPPAANFARGDADLDGAVNITDSIIALGVLFRGADEPGSRCLKAMDVNDDGSSDISDCIYTLLFLFAGGLPIPAPSGGCGEDPTPDSLTCESYSGCPS